MEEASLRLFNSIQVNTKQKQEISDDILKRCICNGYLLDPVISINNDLLDKIEKVVGISGEKVNNAFHKSWKIIQDSSSEDLFVQQIIHYITTYGFERFGMYGESGVYIPNEKLEIPGLNEDIPLTYISALSSEEILSKIVGLGSGIALAKETLDDILVIVERNKFKPDFIEKITNRELKARLNDFYGIVPKEPLEFLRYLISKLTNESLLIKNTYLIEKIKSSNGKFLDELIKDSPENLAEIFYRYKPLFLAMRTISRNKTFFNQLRRKAVAMHKPLLEDYLNNVTAKIRNGILDIDLFRERILKAPIFRKIRLAYALNFRLNSNNSIVYRIRNGRGWATDFEWSESLNSKTKEVLDILLSSIVDDIRKNVSGKTYYIPENVSYSLPSTEKQFTGFFPSGSNFSVSEDLIVGIHWTNNSNRVDLDLAVIGESGKIGWDSLYRSDNNDVLFSGDMTYAPEPFGATELFYIKKGVEEPKIFTVNYFNFDKDSEVDSKIIVAKEKPSDFSSNYMVNPNNVIATANIKVNSKQSILGLIINVNGNNRVYLSKVSIGTSITSTNGEMSTHARKYLVANTVNSIDLVNLLKEAGANIIFKKDQGIDFVDLSPEALDKTTIIKLIQ